MNWDELTDSVKKIKHIKELYSPDWSSRSDNVLGIIFAYKTDYKAAKNNESLTAMHNVVYRAEKYLKEQGLAETGLPVDIVCVLGAGVAARAGQSKWFVYPDNEVDPLLGLWYWLHFLLDTGPGDYYDLKMSRFEWNTVEGSIYFK